MIISGVVLASRPEHLAEVSQALEAITWADVHFSDPKGRLVVTIEAADLDQSADRLKELQRLAHNLHSLKLLLLSTKSLLSSR